MLLESKALLSNNFSISLAQIHKFSFFDDESLKLNHFDIFDMPEVSNTIDINLGQLRDDAMTAKSC